MKRMTAWVLALVMLISPVTANAVTWGEVSTALKSGGSYSKDGVDAKTEDGKTTVSGGSIENVNIGWDDNFADVMAFIFQDTNITGEFTVMSRDDVQYTVTIGENTTVNVENFSVSADGDGSSLILVNEGNVKSSDLMFAEAWNGGYVDVTNEGSMTAADYWHVLSYDSEMISGEIAPGVHSSAAVTNNGVINGNLHGAAEDASSMTLSNNGTIDGRVVLQGYGEASGLLVNSGTVTDDFKVQAWENSDMLAVNQGTLNQEFDVNAGEAGMATGINTGTVDAGFSSISKGQSQVDLVNMGTVGGYFAHTLDQAVAMMENNGTVDGQMLADANDNSTIVATNYETVTQDLLAFSQADITLDNLGTVGGELYGYAIQDAKLNVNNGGSVADQIYLMVEGNGQLAVSSSGADAAKTDVFFDVTTTLKPTATMAEIYAEGSKMVAAIDVSGLTQEQVDGIVYKATSEGYAATYRIALGDDGKLYLVLEEEEEEEDHDDDDEKMTEERYRYLMEQKRKEESLAGVYASPYWCRQLSLGYTNQNLWIHNSEGEKVNFRERLAWVNNGTPEKRLNLRLNSMDLTGVTMRLDGTVFDTLERTEIAYLTILDKNGNVYMDYNVGELKAARQMYGLESADLLVVGGMNDPVMKIGADGALVPVEQ